MKDFIQQLVSARRSPRLLKNVAREYLQARILETLQRYGAFQTWAFVGGTALRFLYQLPRYSEDLDFSAIGSVGDDDFMEKVQHVKTTFTRESYNVDVKVKTGGAVASAFVKFRGLLHELGLSPREEEVLAIRVEIDIRPPAGAGTTTTVVRRHVLLNLFHYDVPSLFAGKLHAILARGFTKGRDIYDLTWYLAQRNCSEPNLEFLNNALLQTGWDGPTLTTANWKSIISEKLRSIDWDHAREDVKPFLERPEELSFVREETVQRMLLE